jgi:hypothetical protein
MSAPAGGNEPFAVHAASAKMAFPTNCEESSMREKLKLVFDTLLVLSLQLVFRAMHLARRLNY